MQLDLDDLPPRIAKQLAALAAGEELVLVQGGLVAARLAVQENAPPPASESLDGLPPEEQMAEVMSQFNAMIHDEF